MQGMKKQSRKELAANAARVALRLDAAKKGKYISFKDAMQEPRKQGED